MNRTLLLFFSLIGVFLFSKTTAQAQPCENLYKYDTLVIGAAGVTMTLTASSSATHSITNDMSAWATISQTGNKITVKVTKSNETLSEHIGHVYVAHGACRDTVVFIQPSKLCQAGMDGTAGRRFWVSFLENISGLSAPTFKLELVTTSSQGASGKVTNPNTGYSSTFTVAANETTTLPINTVTLLTQAYNEIGETVSNKALYIETDNNITLYALNYERQSSDAANILPIETLGNEYYSLSYNSNTNDALGNAATPEEFLIVATENNTLVTIVPTAETEKGKKGGNPFLIKLQRGQSYMVKANLSGAIENKSFYKSITGTYIKSNKSIAVFTGHKRAKIGCSGSNSRDNLYDQLRPIGVWGSRYAVIPTG